MLNSTKNIDGLKNKFDEILYLIDKEVFDEKIWIGENMWKIAEVTYSYNSKQTINGKKVDINSTLFGDIGGLDLSNFDSLTDKEKMEKIGNANDKLVEKIEAKKEKINQILKELENIKTDNQAEIYKKEIIENALKEKLNLFEYALNGLSYELEKAGIEQYFTYEELKKIDAEQKKLDNILFGGQVSDNPKEMELCYKYFCQKLETNKDKLSKTEQKKLKYFIELIKKRKNFPKNFEEKETTKDINLIEKYKQVKIPQKSYLPYFQASVDNIGGDYEIKASDEVGSISDTPKGIDFPTKPEFQELDLLRILKLEQHEILTHCVTDFNNSQNIGNIRGAKSTEKDEGLAILQENILQYGNQLLKKDENTSKMIFDLEKIEATITLALTLMGEILTNEEFQEFLEIAGKMGILPNAPKDRFLRIKRSNRNGVQHKDTSYFRGFYKILEELNKNILSDGKDGVDFWDLFIGKISLEETKKLKYIVEKEKNGQFLKPFFSADITIFLMENGKEKIEKMSEDEFRENFLAYLLEKYPFIDFSEIVTKNAIQKTKNQVNHILQTKNS